MRFDYSLSAIVLHSYSPPTLAAVKHNSSVISSYFNVAPGMTCTCVTVSPGLFVFVYDAAEHPKKLRRIGSDSTMTDEGEEFYQRCLSLLSELDDVRRLFSSTQPPKGRLRLDVPITLARAVIIPALGDFQNRYPDIEIVLGTSDRKIDLIAERVDCVIRLGELNDSSFVARRLGTAAMVTCAAPSYLAKHGTPHSIDELMKSHRAVNFFSNHSLQIMEWKFTVDGSIASIKIPSSILVDNSEAFLSCGLAGLGVLHGLRPSLAPFIASGELTEILTDFPPPPKPVSLLYPDRRYLAPKVRVFIDWLCEVFGPDAHL